jgi:iron complex outermembrane receptor protein
MKKYILFLFLFTVAALPLWAQQDTLQKITIDEVEISALRIATPPLQQPYSIATYRAGTLQETRQQLSLQEYLFQVPGLFSLNANNYAQDLRISIRGFGARSAFGIRGVNIVVDGIPETTPDGQGQIDNLNIGIIDRLEVLKGPSSALYGNASGGVIQIYTRDNFDRNFLNAGLTFGSFNMQQYQLSGGWKHNNTRAILQGTHTRTDGYRAQSSLENTNFNARLFHDFSERSKINFQFNYTNSPVGDDPGGISAEDVATDRRQARDQNVRFQAGEAINQLKLGGQYQYELDANKSLQLYGFYSTRDFVGLLPIGADGWVELQRAYYGQGGSFKTRKAMTNGTNTFQAGYEWALQNDDRRRFANNEGVKGDLALDQIERFSTIALYVLDHLSVNRWLFSFGMRYDLNILSADDQLRSDGDQSGERDLSAFNPSIGVNFELTSNLHLYGSYRTSFETPSLSELSANPSGEAGFDPDLKSQRAYNYELGLKGLLGNNMDFDLTLFHIDTENDLVPYELEAFPGRTFYRNAGSTARDGVELWLRYQFSRAFSLRGSYTYSAFTYNEYVLDDEDFAGKLLPAIPPHLLALQLAYESEAGLNLRLQHRYTAEFFADDANTATEPAYQVTDLSLSYRFQLQKSTLVPFLGVNNIFGSEYSDNVRINAFGGRYYEPAPGINFFGGIRLNLEGK